VIPGYVLSGNGGFILSRGVKTGKITDLTVSKEKGEIIPFVLRL
jgi:hypothetical protein